MKIIPIIAIAVTGFWINAVYSQALTDTNSAIIQHTIHSDILQRDQHIQIYLPDAYVSTSRRFPVLYILDGQFYFYYGVAFQQTSEWQSKSPEFIVVGISTSDKQLRELDFDIDQRRQNYREFLEKELITFVDRTYRTMDDRMIFGWQSAGYLVIETLFQRPDLFTAYFVASGAVADSADFEQFAGRGLAAERFLYYTLSSSETWALGAFNDITKKLDEKAPEFLRWKNEMLPEEDHWSTPYRTIYRGITEYYRPFQPLQFDSLEAFELAGGLDQLVSYYQQRGERYGVSPAIHPSTIFNLLMLSMRADDYTSFHFFMNHFTGEVPGLYPARWHHRYGAFYLQHDQPEQALVVYQKAIERMPGEAQLYAGMAEVFLKLGDKKQAAVAYQKAAEIAKAMDDPEWMEYSKKQ